MLNRVIKNAVAMLLGQGIQTVTRLMLPPLLIVSYGMALYGEWLVLTAAVSYLSVLDFGVQTYVINQLIMLYHRGERERFSAINTAGAWLILMLAALGSLLLILAFSIPYGELLGMTLPDTTVAAIVFLLGMDIVVRIIFGYVNGLFRIFGKAHRGSMWINAHSVTAFTAIGALALGDASLVHVAMIQPLVATLLTLLMFIDLKRIAPDVVPSLRVFDRAAIRFLAKPSFFYALGSINNMLVYQVPIIVIQKFIGPSAVVIFATIRMLFSTARQILTPIQHSLMPEITRIVGSQDSNVLKKLYAFSTRIALLGGISLGFAILLLSRPIIGVWLGGRITVEPILAGWISVITMTTMVRESGYVFLYAMCRHEQIMSVMAVSYVGMVILMWIVAPLMSLIAMSAIWCVSEVGLAFVTHHFTRRFISLDEKHPSFPRLLLFLPLIVPAVLFVSASETLSLSMQIIAGVGMSVVVLIMAFVVFDGKRLVSKAAPLWANT